MFKLILLVTTTDHENKYITKTEILAKKISIADLHLFSNFALRSETTQA